jgi:plastocyanin
VSRVLRRSTLLGLLMVTVLAQGALAATTNVSIQGSAFSPSGVRVRQGDTVKWTNNDFQTHTATSDGYDGTSGPQLWNSGVLGHAATYSFTFVAAGKFAYHCTIHSFMHGSVAVGLRVNPTSGTTATTFTVTWATAAGVPANYNEDVQVLRPGTTTWANWRTNQTGTSVSATFTPDAGTGTYKFRARLQKGTGGASGYSAAKAITVS